MIIWLFPNFNPRPPRGGRLQHLCSCHRFQRFQSTPPARGATGMGRLVTSSLIFQSTPPARGATALFCGLVSEKENFNPRPPRGGRRRGAITPTRQRVFQSTPPARGATARGRTEHHSGSISIHAPREGGDLDGTVIPISQYISIHAPREGGDLVAIPHFLGVVTFQSTPPARGATNQP